MLSSTFFHWQKRVNLSLREKKKETQMSKMWIYCMWWISSIQSFYLHLRLTSQWTSGRSSLSSCRRSPLCMAAGGERHTNSSSGQVSLSKHMWVSPLCIVLMDELDLVLLTLRFCLVLPCWKRLPPSLLSAVKANSLHRNYHWTLMRCDKWAPLCSRWGSNLSNAEDSRNIREILTGWCHIFVGN